MGTITRSIRGALVGKLLDVVGLTTSDAISQETKPYRIKRDNHDVAAVIFELKATINPFSTDTQNKALPFTIWSPWIW